MSNDTSGVLWRRLKYMLSPQLDVYKHLAARVSRQDVLEIGFGTGFGTVQLASTANRVVATEIDPSAIAFANWVFPLRNITWTLHDITSSEEKMGGFDAVVCLEVLEHVPDWRTALKHIELSLADNGTLYISGPNANANLRKTDLHEREWTAAEFHAALGEYFSDVQLYDYTLTNKQDLDTGLTPLLAVCTNV